MTPDPRIASIAKGLTPKARDAIKAMDGEYRSAASISGVSRQAIAALGSRYHELVQSEWQDGCAQCLYYRLSTDGLAVRTYLQEQDNG